MAELQSYTVDPTVSDQDTVLGANADNSNVTVRFTIGSIITKALDDVSLGDLGITATAAEINYLDNDDLTADDITKLAALTATAAEINKLDGLSTTATELGYVAGVTSAIQTQIDAKEDILTGAATTISGADLTASRALISNASGKVGVSDVTSTELGYLDGVTSAIQTQIDNIDQFSPANTGSADQVLVKTSTGYQWQDAEEATYTLPTAGPSTKGGVLVPLTSDIDIDSSGNLSLGNISANKITSGVITPARLSNTTPVNGYFLRYNSTTKKLEYAAANTDVTFNAADDITFTGHVKIESTDDTDTFTVTPPVDFTDASIKFSGLTGGGTDKVLGISSTGLLSVVDKGGGDSSITVTSTSVSDGTNTFNKYTLPDLTTADFAAATLATTSELTDDSDTTIPTTAWVKDQGYLTSSGITVTSSSVSDGTNTFNKYTLPTNLSTLPSTIIDPSTLASDHPYALTADASADDYKWRQFASKLDVGGVTLNVEESGISYTVHSRTSGTENATDGHVLTANGTGGVAWEAQTGTQLTDAEVIQAIVDSTSITDADKSTIRTNIGAGTSNLVIGTTATTALAGNTTIPTVTSTSVTDGTNTFNKLTQEEVEDWVGGMVTGNTETGISVTYQDSDGTLDFAVSQYAETLLTDYTGTSGTTSATAGHVLTADGDGTVSWKTPGALTFDQAADYTLTGSIGFTPGSGETYPTITGTDPYINFVSTETSADGNEIGGFSFSGLRSSDNTQNVFAKIIATAQDVGGDASLDGDIAFWAQRAGTLTKMMEVDGISTKFFVDVDFTSITNPVHFGGTIQADNGNVVAQATSGAADVLAAINYDVDSSSLTDSDEIGIIASIANSSNAFGIQIHYNDFDATNDNEWARASFRVKDSDSGGTGETSDTNYLDIDGENKAIIAHKPIRIGGTGTANELDDYEEGDWTPSDESGASLTLTNVQHNTYVKVGRMVFVQGEFTMPTTTDGKTSEFGTLPFTVQGDTFDVPIGQFYVEGSGQVGSLFKDESTTFRFLWTDDAQSNDGDYSYVLNSSISGQRIHFTMTYYTTQ